MKLGERERERSATERARARRAWMAVQAHRVRHRVEKEGGEESSNLSRRGKGKGTGGGEVR